MNRLLAFLFEFLEAFSPFPEHPRLDHQADLRFAGPWRRLVITLLLMAIFLAVGFVCLMIVTAR